MCVILPMWLILKLGSRSQFHMCQLLGSFLMCFRRSYPGMPPEWHVEFRIDLVLGAALIAKHQTEQFTVGSTDIVHQE